jgi:hypothetical protein
VRPVLEQDVATAGAGHCLDGVRQTPVLSLELAESDVAAVPGIDIDDEQP